MTKPIDAATAELACGPVSVRINPPCPPTRVADSGRIRLGAACRRHRRPQ
jgi:hypothetical protein